MKSYDPKIVSFQRNAGYLHQKAMRNRRAGSQIDAMELMRQAVLREPDNAEYLLDLSALYSEMGLFEQSNRLLSRVMTLPNGPSECLYGMALNMLKQGDAARAETLLRAYVDKGKPASHESDARRLLDEIEMAREMSFPESRKMSRVNRLSERGINAMRTGEHARAARLFEKCVLAGGGNCEIYALIALCHVMLGNRERALNEARKASDMALKAKRGALKALCVCAQVYYYLNDEKTSRVIISSALGLDADRQEMRMLAAALCELDMHAEASDCIARCLRSAPYDKMLLHMAAVAAYNAGGAPKASLKHWERIKRLDPDDAVAAYFADAAAHGILPERPLDYAYQLPKEEISTRVKLLSGYLSSGDKGLEFAWREDYRLKVILTWAVSLNHEHLTRMALTILAAIDDEDAMERVRAYAIRPDAPFEIKMHALTLVRLKGEPEGALKDMLIAAAGLPTEEEALEGLGVGERQMVRYAAEYIEDKHGDFPVVSIAILYRAFKERRGSACDPVYRTEAGSAALALCFSEISKRSDDIYTISKWFGCSARQAAHIARRIRDVVTLNSGAFEEESHV